MTTIRSCFRSLSEKPTPSPISKAPILCILSIGLKTINMGFFIVLEFIDGQTLKQLMNSRTLSVEESCSIISQVLKGLYTAHEKNIIHRDIKPSNVMVKSGGLENFEVKITDFGIAKVVDDERTQYKALNEAESNSNQVMSPLYGSQNSGKTPITWMGDLTFGP